MSGENKYGITAIGLGYKVGETAGQYAHKLDSVAANTPANKPLFGNKPTYGAIGLADKFIFKMGGVMHYIPMVLLLIVFFWFYNGLQIARMRFLM